MKNLNIRKMRKESDPSDLFPERSIERSNGGDDLREASGSREVAAELGAMTDVGDTVKSFRPPVVPFYPQPWHRCGIVHQKPNLLF